MPIIANNMRGVMFDGTGEVEAPSSFLALDDDLALWRVGITAERSLLYSGGPTSTPYGKIGNMPNALAAGYNNDVSSARAICMFWYKRELWCCLGTSFRGTGRQARARRGYWRIDLSDPASTTNPYGRVYDSRRGYNDPDTQNIVGVSYGGTNVGLWNVRGRTAVGNAHLARIDETNFSQETTSQRLNDLTSEANLVYDASRDRFIVSALPSAGAGRLIGIDRTRGRNTTPPFGRITVPNTVPTADGSASTGAGSVAMTAHRGFLLAVARSFFIGYAIADLGKEQSDLHWAASIDFPTGSGSCIALASGDVSDGDYEHTQGSAQ